MSSRRMEEGEGSFGLSEKAPLKDTALEEGYYGADSDELFSNERGEKPWWLSRLFLSERTLFGAWDGVFTSCLVNLLGVIVFLRCGWLVAQAGIIEASLISLVTVVLVATSILSAIGVMSRTEVEGGGVHFLVSHVLGSRMGGTIGLVYCFGQAVGISLCVAGFGESMSELLHYENPWADRVFAAFALLVLGIINVAGVKWVVKIQVLLLFLILLSVMDLVVGSFLEHKHEGVTGWSLSTWKENLWPHYREANWFVVFGVFFPTVTGCMAGINMSGDIRNPEKNIPLGSLASLVFSLLIYLCFIVVLGATVNRNVLYSDLLIAEKVASTGVLLLIGLYTSTLASSLASLYGTPRVLQSIAAERVIPIIAPLQMGRGPNRVPLLALFVVVLTTGLFVLVGPINTLAPIVTMPFLATYAAIDYAYFALCMASCTKNTRKGYILATNDQEAKSPLPHSDLDRLFPERVMHKKVITRSAESSEASSANSSANASPKKCRSGSAGSTKEEQYVGEGAEGENELLGFPSQGGPTKPQRNIPQWVLPLCNKWVALIAAVSKVLLMLAVHALYGAITIVTIFLLYFYIGRTSPGLPPGIGAHFSFLTWSKKGVLLVFGKHSEQSDELIMPPVHPGVGVEASQLTQDNKDFANRSRFHHSRFENALEGGLK